MSEVLYNIVQTLSLFLTLQTIPTAPGLKF